MQRMRKNQAYLLCFSLCGFFAPPLIANELDPLFLLPLDELMNVDVALTSRKEEKQFNAPAAVYVLTQEDIHRSGHRRLSEILRMVPGLHVAKIDANKWVVSSRNNQLRYSSTMLVMIDGRNIYSPFYAGVYWESQDTFLEDIDRIEIVRGPGGSLWGTNAVDGIINIITKTSADTQGIKAYALAGQGEMKSEAGFRYGGTTNNGIHYRAYAKGYKTDTGEYVGPRESTNNGLAPIGSDANDDGRAEQAGFRADWARGQDNYTLQGNAYAGNFDEDRVVNSMRVPNTLDTEGHNFSLSWKRKLSGTDSLAVNTFYDYNSRDDDLLQNDETTMDIDFQHSMTIGDHNPIWGLGFRHYYNDARPTTPSGCSATAPCFAVDPETKRLNTWSAFIQDRIAISETFSLIVGSKFEENEYTGFEYQPTLRGLWTPDNDTTYWGAITRAVRVPDRVNTDGILDFGTSTFPIGNKDEESFINYAYELGYRKRLANNWALDGTVFYSDYQNTLQGTAASGLDYTYGFEAYIKHEYSAKLGAELGYAYNNGRTDLASGGDRPINMLPKYTSNFRSYYKLKDNMELDAQIYYVSDAESPSGNTVIPAYTRFDLRYEWRPTTQWETSLLLTNIFDDVHAEGYDTVKINTGVNQGIMLKITYTTDE